MMKTRFFLPLGLLAAILAACAPPQATQVPALPSELVLPSPTALQPVAPTELPATSAPILEVPTQTPLAVATSRGPDLHASDPTAVSLASGQYQLVEFFRFT